MSYILDALKKSDQERQRKITPDIHTVHATLEPERGRRRLWPFFLILALALNAGLLLWWIHPWQAQEPNPEAIGTHQSEHATSTRRSSQEPIVARSTPAAENPANPKPRSRKPMEASSKSSILAEPSQGKPASEPAGSRLRLASNSSKLANPGSTPNQDPVETKPEARRTPDSRSTKAKQLPREKSAAPETMSKRGPRAIGTNQESALKAKATPPALSHAELPSENDSAGRRAAHPSGTSKVTAKARPVVPREQVAPGTTLPQEAPSSAKPPAALGEELRSLLDSDSKSEERVTQLHDLPFEIRQDLPSLSLSMLIYAKNPADRMVGINGQVLHEGEAVGIDLKLERITPNGAIFTFRGHRFYKGVH